VKIDYRITASSANCQKKPALLVDCLSDGFTMRTLVFKPGGTGLTPASKTIKITMLADDFIEPNETVRAELWNPRATDPASSLVLSIDRAVGIATIVNDD
jgi:hypothetical protein